MTPHITITITGVAKSGKNTLAATIANLLYTIGATVEVVESNPPDVNELTCPAPNERLRNIFCGKLIRIVTHRLNKEPLL